MFRSFFTKGIALRIHYYAGSSESAIRVNFITSGKHWTHYHVGSGECILISRG